MYRSLEQALYRIYNGEDGFGSSPIARLISTGMSFEPDQDRLSLHERLANDSAAKALLEREIPKWQCALLEMKWSEALKVQKCTHMQEDLRACRVGELYRLVEPHISWHPQVKRCDIAKPFLRLEAKAWCLQLDSGLVLYKESKASTLKRHRRIIRSVINEFRDEAESMAEAVLVEEGHLR